jgi:hypothetical protein
MIVLIDMTAYKDIEAEEQYRGKKKREHNINSS